MKLIDLLNEIQGSEDPQKAVFLHAQPDLVESSALSQDQILETLKNATTELSDVPDLANRPNQIFIGSTGYLKRSMSEFPGDINADFDQFCQWMNW